ncbi:MAG: mechanosensitive ion channel family protein [Nocardioides sp.]|uniref:mechanosensitive ion channel family protein n=1 Tax=Nocardioides sp. TaxID=35761 RepID=UPI0039E728A9
MDWREVGQRLLGWPLAVVGLIVGGLVVRWLLFRAIDRIVRRTEDGVLPDRMAALSTTDPSRRVQRARTIGSLLKSIISGVTFAVVGTMILSEFVNIAPIIASAGIAGVALGFGAQSLVKDFLSGIFMIFEDQYGVGDVVDAGEATGTVEAVGLRVTRLRDGNGTVWYVRNGEILRVGNMSQSWARTVLDIAVSYTEDIDRAKAVLEKVAGDLWHDPEYKSLVIAEPQVWVEDLGADRVTMRVVLKTAPMEQWRVARELRARIKTTFDDEGIKVPPPVTPPAGGATPGMPPA